MKTKLLLTILSSFLGLLVAVLLIQFGYIYPRFLDLEKAQIITNTQRVNNALNEQASILHRSNKDWSAWTEAYEFGQGSNNTFMQQTLSAPMLSNLNIDAIAFFNAKGQSLWSNINQINASTTHAIDEKKLSQLKQQLPLRNSTDSPISKGRMIIIKMQPYYWIFSIQPLLKNDSSGPASGSLFMGVRLDSEFISALSQQTKNTVQLVTPAVLPEDITTKLNNQSIALLYQPSSVVSYQKISLSDKDNPLYLKSTFPRSIATHGFYAILISSGIYLLVASLSCLAIYLLVNHGLIKPLTQLTRHAIKLGINHNKTAALHFKRNDEIGMLANAFDRMMFRINEVTTDLKNMTIIDELTQVYNRRYFNERIALNLRQAIRQKTSLSLIMCDIDHFKLFNDTYGHVVGDDCLKAVATIVQDSLSRPMDSVSRYGGEEFVILLPDTSKEGACQVAKTIQKSIKKLAIPHAYSLTEPFITISCGIVSLVPDKTIDEATLIEMTDHALYQAKQQGRNKTIVA